MGCGVEVLATNNNMPKIQLTVVLVSVAYFSTTGAGFSALYGGVISLINTVLIDRHIRKQKNNTDISARAIVVVVVVSVVLRMAVVVGLISIGVLVLKLSASALVVSLVLGICGFLVDKVLPMVFPIWDNNLGFNLLV